MTKETFLNKIRMLGASNIIDDKIVVSYNLGDTTYIRLFDHIGVIPLMLLGNAELNLVIQGDYGIKYLDFGSNTYGQGLPFKSIIVDVYSDDISVETISFRNCKQLQSIRFKRINTSKLESFIYCFRNCVNLKELDISNLDLRNLLDMVGICYGCKRLERFILGDKYLNKLVTVKCAFKDCESLKEVVIGSVEAKLCSQVQEVFSGCTQLESLNLSRLIIHRLNRANNAFENCKSLKELRIPNISGHLYVPHNNEFNNCSKLERLVIAEELLGPNHRSTLDYIEKECPALKDLRIQI